MKNQYKVSVVIPVYNAAQFVRKAVESVMSLPETGEVLLIDDGSKDDSLKVCHQIAEQYRHVRVFQHPDAGNKGAAASRNIGILNAGFEFISFLDADDYYLPNRFQKEQEVFAQHPDADGVYGCNQEVFESEKAKELYLQERTSILTTITEVVEPERLYRCLLFGGYGEFHTSTITLRKRAFERAGIFNTAIRHVEDTELWIKLALTCRLYPGSINEPLTMRLVHETNSIHQWEKIKPYKDLMYQSLFDWILTQPVSFTVKNEFFTALYFYTKGVHTDAKQLFREQVLRHPSMIFSNFFIKKIHQLYFGG
jgi:glycosyltransferase involved in cell wall biosynthesis